MYWYEESEFHMCLWGTCGTCSRHSRSDNQFRTFRVCEPSIWIEISINLLVTARRMYSLASKCTEELEYSNQRHAKKSFFLWKGASALEKETNYDGLDWKGCERIHILYPGRSQCRLSILFDPDNKDARKHACTKNYLTSRTHLDGIFTVQYVCSHPRLLVISYEFGGSATVRRSGGFNTLYCPCVNFALRWRFQSELYRIL